MLFVYMKEVQHLDTFGHMSIILIDKNGIVTMIMKVIQYSGAYISENILIFSFQFVKLLGMMCSMLVLVVNEHKAIVTNLVYLVHIY